MQYQLGQQEPDIVITELDELLLSNDFTSLSTRPIEELRVLRDRLGEIEGGLSFGRRMAQGRLDIVIAESHARSTGGPASARELLDRLPEVLSGQTRGGGNPRPIRDIELPLFADEITEELDELLHPSDLVAIEALTDDALQAAADRITGYERMISVKRHEVHRLMDDLQEEIIGRYRSGSVSVDDLLRG